MRAVVGPITSVPVTTELEVKGMFQECYVDYMYTVLVAVGSRWATGASMWRTVHAAVFFQIPRATRQWLGRG